MLAYSGGSSSGGSSGGGATSGAGSVGSSDGARRRHKLKTVLARNVSRITRLQERVVAAQEQLRAAEELRHRLDAIEERMSVAAQGYDTHLQQAWVSMVSAAREQELALANKRFELGSVETMMRARQEVDTLRRLVDGARREKRRSVDVCRWPIFCVRTTFVAWGEVVLRTTLAFRWCASWCGRRRPERPGVVADNLPAPSRPRLSSMSLAQRRAAQTAGIAPGVSEAAEFRGDAFGDGDDPDGSGREPVDDAGHGRDGLLEASRSPRHGASLHRRPPYV